MKMFRYKEFTVVGTARSPLFLNFQRGTSNEGSGSISFYVCALPGAFDSEYYTEAYLYADNGFYIYSDEYKDWASTAEKQYKASLNSVIRGRFESMLKEEYDKLYDGVDEFNESIDDARKELEDARKKLDDAKKELEDAQAEVDKNREKLDEGKETLDKSAQQLYEYGQQLYSTKTALDEAAQRAESSKAEMDSLKNEIDSLFDELTAARSDLRRAMAETAAKRSVDEYLLASYKASLEALEASLESNRERLENAEGEWERLWL
jgi:putative ABC transport system permease protein